MLCMISSILVSAQFGNDTYIDFAKSPAGFPYVIPNEIKCTADFDGDGYKDILFAAIGYSSYPKIALIKNNAGTSFSDPKIIYNYNTIDSRYYNIFQIVAADMNNDGKMDFVVYFNSAEIPTSSGRISWFKNLGNNSFQENLINGISGNGSTMSLTDMDHNGYKDIVIATTTSGIGKIYIAKNTNGVFQVTTVAATAQFFTVTPDDMNNDGFIDLVGESDQGIYWFKNNNDTSFTQKQNLNTTSNSLKIVIADFDNDGLKDIVYADQSSNVLNFYKIKNNGSGTFSASVAVSQNIVNSDVKFNWQLVDVDEDNLLDISIINSNRNSYLKNLGGFTFSNSLSKVYIPNSPGLDSLGHFGFYFQDDFTNDNIKEFAIVSFDSLLMCSKTGPAKYVTSFTKSIIPAFSSIICTSDVNNDGYTDILAVGKYNGSRILKYPQNSNHTFATPTVIIDSAYDATILLSAKFNNDNLPDIIYYSRRNNAIYYSQNNGATFASPQAIAISILTDSLFITDIDGDNDLDIIGYHNMEIFSYLNNGNNTFSTKNVIYTSPYSISYLQVNDFDKNSKNDIIYSSFNSNKIEWLKNMGYPTFSAIEINNTFNKPASFAVGDLDGDGQKDLLVHDYVNYANQSQLYILYNNNFSFTVKVIIDNYNLLSGDLTLLRYSNFRIEDVNNDGDNDILLRATGISNDFHYTVFTNDGLGNFTKIYNATAAHFNQMGKYYFVKEGVITEDIDNDGDKDFISSSGYDDIVITTTQFALSAFSAGIDQTICSGQSVTLTATGASSYTWSNGQTTASIQVSPTTTTTYIVTGIVNSVSKKDTVIVNVNPKPSVSAGTDQSICSGSATTITATGASSYSWNTGQSAASFSVTPTTTTTYIVTGTNAQNCSAKDTVVVTVKPKPIVSAGIDQSVCSGSATTITATGASSYSWNTGQSVASFSVSPTTTTTYIVTGTNAQNCSAKDTVVVTVKPKPIVSAGIDQSICSGSATTITATGASSYSWNTGQSAASFSVSPTTTTTYIVTGTNAQNCSAKDTVIVTVKPLPNVNFTKIVNGTNVQFSGPGGNTSYSWSFGDATPNSTTQSPLHVYTTNGKKYITLTATLNGCSAQKLDSVVISITAISNNISFVDNIDIYPNPTDNFVRVQLNAKKSASFNISLISIDGKIVVNKDYKNTATINDEIDMKIYSSGVYLLQISSENEQSTYQIIKQ
jgi:PKD repeat protein